MRLLISFLFCVFLCEFSFGQDTIFIATANYNKNIIRYTQQVDSNVVYIDFMKVKFEQWDSIFKKCSGLLLSGGADLHPARYDRKDWYIYCQLETHRDQVEWYLIQDAVRDSIPILGICRGLQVLNVYFGGSLCADVGLFCGGKKRAAIHRDPALKKDIDHLITSKSGSLIASLFGTQPVMVNSYHHQMIDQLAPDFLATAHTEDQGIEAIEYQKSNQWIVAVQWHPERYYKKDINNLKLIECFLEQVKSN
ncbi:MAG: hypothetical protein RL264_2524 [Bacteroidota bacterium]|jgi:putative glutamine amidotransferase